ncbi:hypothetical protein NY2A_b449L [Paramecium bursaria Chlorella virus NY2A]|uniref:Uncharacterized protein b449L n=1 Tax=Paramecium bursaria Chlorella virus NY2A TaxID=46021 RepID=A7IWX4_PBCVN|nr:hypothetical protein NY2A_b449L [Paramecium bursaria Chlorella virus NY2A]ABT14848.1 hypothetical protein NY2A_b449L [Paramecium bursaria Chlorella virus NY2A]
MFRIFDDSTDTTFVALSSFWSIALRSNASFCFKNSSSLIFSSLFMFFKIVITTAIVIETATTIAAIVITSHLLIIYYEFIFCEHFFHMKPLYSLFLSIL